MRDHLETFLAERERADAPLPRFVTDELRRRARRCPWMWGVLAKGCAHFRCESCGVDRVVALSCKGRGETPRASARLVVLAETGQLRGLRPLRLGRFHLGPARAAAAAR